MNKPTKCISVEEAKKLEKNWLETRADWIDKKRSTGDTCEFLFSLETLQEFLDYVKEGSKSQQIDAPGIRIYFAAYNNEKSTMATVFLAPTVGTSPQDDNNYKLEPLNTISGGWPPKKYGK